MRHNGEKSLIFIRWIKEEPDEHDEMQKGGIKLISTKVPTVMNFVIPFGFSHTQQNFTTLPRIDIVCFESKIPYLV